MRWHRSEHWGKIRYAENLPPDFDPDYKFYSYEGVRDIYSVFAREQYTASEKLLINLEAQLGPHTVRTAERKSRDHLHQLPDDRRRYSPR